MVRRIAALVLLEPELDENYIAAKADFYTWTTAKDSMVPASAPE